MLHYYIITTGFLKVRVPRIRENYQGKYLNGYCNEYFWVSVGPYRVPNIFLRTSLIITKSFAQLF